MTPTPFRRRRACPLGSQRTTRLGVVTMVVEVEGCWVERLRPGWEVWRSEKSPTASAQGRWRILRIPTPPLLRLQGPSVGSRLFRQARPRALFIFAKLRFVPSQVGQHFWSVGLTRQNGPDVVANAGGPATVARPFHPEPFDVHFKKGKERSWSLAPMLWVHRYRSEFAVHNRSEFVDLQHDTKSIMLNCYNSNGLRIVSEQGVKVQWKTRAKAKKIADRCVRVHAWHLVPW